MGHQNPCLTNINGLQPYSLKPSWSLTPPNILAMLWVNPRFYIVSERCVAKNTNDASLPACCTCRSRQSYSIEFRWIDMLREMMLTMTLWGARRRLYQKAGERSPGSRQGLGDTYESSKNQHFHVCGESTKEDTESCGEKCGLVCTPSAENIAKASVEWGECTCCEKVAIAK